MTKSYFYVLGVIAVTLGVSSAATEEEIEAVRAAVRPFLDSCGEQFGITREQLLAAKAAGKLGELDPCFHDCFFKKIGFINASGLFDIDVAVEKNNKYFKGADNTAKTGEMKKMCASVNEQTVSDGDKGCERAKLIYDCVQKTHGNLLQAS